MNGPFRLAWNYICHHKFKSLVLIASIVLTVLLPVTIRILLWQFNQKIVSRADETTAVIGATGSDLDLALNATYFRSNSNLVPLRYDELEFVRETGWAKGVPIHAKFTAKSFKVVGTSLDYFEFRSLKLRDGFFFATLGDCVLGNEVAESLSLSVGDQIISDRKNAIAFGGETPLRMNVVGILGKRGSPDDRAVFVDVKTAWVIEGLGHGHEDLSDEPEDSVKVLQKTEKQVIASAGVVDFIEITDSNIQSFHFHGDTAEFPLTSIIAIADSEKNETLLEGRYETGRANLQFTRPPKVIRELMAMVFQVNRFFEANSFLVAVATAMLLGLVVVLSLRLRMREMETMFRLGSSRSTIAWLQIWELAIILFFAAVILAGLIGWIWSISDGVVQALLTQG